MQTDQLSHVFKRLSWDLFQAVVVQNDVLQAWLQLLKSIGANVADLKRL